MTKKSLAAAVAEYKEYKALVKEAEAELERLESVLKSELAKKGVEELDVGGTMVRNTSFIQKRFDSKGFRTANPELYESFTKAIKGYRFSVA